MPDISHRFPINAPISRVFETITSPAGLDRWWTLSSAGAAAEGENWELGFGPGYEWRAVVTSCRPDRAFELELTEADADWVGTRVGFELEDSGDATLVEFHHSGWAAANEHYRTSCYCWAMYLRILKRYLELGERVAYGRRLDV